MEVLEIQVKDEVKVFDSVGEAVEFIETVLKKLFEYHDTFEANIIIRKKNIRGPPSLGIKVNERVRTKEALS